MEYDIALLMQVYALQEFDEHCNKMTDIFDTIL